MISDHIRPSPPKVLTIEYDCQEERKRKTFMDVYKARSFWMAKDRAGKSPKYVK